jgi:hypothetical protein
MSVMELARPNLASDLRLTPQARTILGHLLRHGQITPQEALTVYSIPRLASCIHEIRTKGQRDVNTAIRRDDQGHKYSRYTLKRCTAWTPKVAN